MKVIEEAIVSDEEIVLENKHQMGWFSGMCMVIGLMVGSGIFSTPSEILKNVEAPGLAILFWLIGGIVTFCGTL
jgi:amino acid transporter